MKTVESVLKKPANQDVVVALLKTIEDYFTPVRPHQEIRREIDIVLQDANLHSCLCDESCYREQLTELYDEIPDVQPLVESMLVFSCVGEQLVNPIFALTDAVGSVMRRKIEPLTSPLSIHLDRLLAKS